MIEMNGVQHDNDDDDANAYIWRKGRYFGSSDKMMKNKWKKWIY